MHGESSCSAAMTAAAAGTVASQSMLVKNQTPQQHISFIKAQTHVIPNNWYTIAQSSSQLCTIGCSGCCISTLQIMQYVHTKPRHWRAIAFCSHMLMRRIFTDCPSCQLAHHIIVTTNQPTNHSTNQPTNQPTNQSINQPTNQLTNQPTNQSINQPTNQPTDRPTNQPTNLDTPVWPLTSCAATFAADAHSQPHSHVHSEEQIRRTSLPAIQPVHTTGGMHAYCQSQATTLFGASAFVMIRHYAQHSTQCTTGCNTLMTTTQQCMPCPAEPRSCSHLPKPQASHQQQHGSFTGSDTT
jgi:hypothetical protein